MMIDRKFISAPRPVAFALLLLVASTFQVSCLLREFFPGNPLPTVPGPESETLIENARGVIVMNPGHAITIVELPSRQETTIRGDGERGYIHSLSGPDASGDIAFIEGHNSWFSLNVIRHTGTGEKMVFRREGDALWGEEIGDQLALSPRGHHVAFVRDHDGVQLDDPPRHYDRGSLAVWNIDSEMRQGRFEFQAVDERMSWFPNGNRLALVDLVGVEECGTADEEWLEETRHGDLTLAVFVLDLESGTRTLLCPGTQPLVSPDGERVLVTNRSGSFRLLDLSTGGSRTVSPPSEELWPLALLDGNVLLYRGYPTEGTPVRFSHNNSPLVGPQPLWALKLTDLDDGTHQTILPHVDYRTEISYGQIEMPN